MGTWPLGRDQGSTAAARAQIALAQETAGRVSRDRRVYVAAAVAGVLVVGLVVRYRYLEPARRVDGARPPHMRLRLS
jgi:hypothetical protein